MVVSVALIYCILIRFFCFLLPPDSRRGDKCSIQATKLASW